MLEVREEEAGPKESGPEVQEKGVGSRHKGGASGKRD